MPLSLMQKRPKQHHSLLLTQFGVNLSAEATFTLSTDGFILDANGTACKRLEYSSDELVGMRITDIDPHYPIELWHEYFEDLRRSRKTTIETQYRSKSGRVFDVKVSAAHLEFEAVEYCCSSARDITKHKQAEQLLRLPSKVLGKVTSTSERMTKTQDELCNNVEEFVPNSMVTVMLCDETNGALRFAAGPQLNAIVCRAFEPLAPAAANSGSCGAAAFLKCPVIIADTRCSPHWSELQDIVQKFQLLACWSLPILDEHQQLLGTFAISHNRNATPDKFQTKLLETASHLANIAIRKQRFEEQLRLTHAELAHVSRLSTMGEMASSTAHELNQPLTSIVNDAYGVERVLQRQTSDLPMVRELAISIHQQAIRAAEIFKGMCNLAKKTTPTSKQVDPRDLIHTSLALVEFDLRNHGITLREQICDHCPIIDADTVQFQKVLLNQIRNSIDAMESIPRADRAITLTFDKTEKEIRLSVADTGKGPSEEDPESLFEAFATTKSVGIGMGLNISRSIAEAHSGRLIAGNTNPQGVVFTIVLPLSTER